MNKKLNIKKVEPWKKDGSWEKTKYLNIEPWEKIKLWGKIEPWAKSKYLYI